MNAEVKRKWIEALRSGRYKQGQKRLRQGGEEGAHLYCCLGVLCDLHREEVGGTWVPCNSNDPYFSYDNDAAILPHSVQEWAGLHAPSPSYNEYDEQVLLTELNDHGTTFQQIADIIERKL